MNKKLIATAVAATLAAPMAFAASHSDDDPNLALKKMQEDIDSMRSDFSVYGRLHLGIEIDDNSNVEGDTSADIRNNSSRFGIRGETDLGNGLSTVYRYEFGVAADKADIQDNNRLSYVGLKGGFGQVSLGRQWSAMFNHVGTFMDITQVYGTSGTTYRISDDLQYSVSAGPVNIQADFVLDGGNNASDGADRIQIAGSGGNDVFSAGIGIETQDGATTTDDDGVSTTAADRDQVGIGARVNFGAFFISGGHVTTDIDGGANDPSTTVVNFGASSDSGLSGFLQFGNQEDASGGDTDFVIGQIRKQLGGGTQVYIEGRADDLEADDSDDRFDDDRTRIVFGLRKDF